ncbi:MAG: TrmH family RNA methyltransferase [Epulopiscium sp.]|nr:TrmH family RNA methyltransferase [Candidatus Epulonipiscium sp.]
MLEKLKRYNKKSRYSYSFGAFPTIELLRYKSQNAVKVLISSKFNNREVVEEIKRICDLNKIEVATDDKTISRISNKENDYVIGVFEKYTDHIEGANPHVVLVNPSDSGNVGTIIRSSLGFGIKNIAIIEPAVDIYHPNVVRSSMGALFRVRIEKFDSFGKYCKMYKNHKKILFMLDGAKTMEEIRLDKDELYSLVFGNESSGLDSSCKKYGEAVFIQHQDTIDSLNLSIAASIGIYYFTR